MISSKLRRISSLFVAPPAALIGAGWVAGCGELLNIDDPPETKDPAAPPADVLPAPEDAASDGRSSAADAQGQPPSSSLVKNPDFEAAPGATIDLDDPTTFPPDYVQNGGWIGLPNEPYNTVIADGYGRNGTRGARMTRASATSGTELPGFRQQLPITPAERGCTYRATVDVYAEDASAKLRLILAFDLDNGVHAGLHFVDATGTVGQWETLTIQQAGPASALYTTVEVSVGPQSLDYFGGSRADNFYLERTCP